ncbi:DUF2971 domain-containing protein [Bradyrhizobium sp. 27S5]|uniref:DUF2971 domain-containing protein n=1 Tax=Bradyrhizobium sp. 27S5 TaxID=3139728 RepID=UPI0030D312DC
MLLQSDQGLAGYLQCRRGLAQGVSRLVWSGYAENPKGIAIRIELNLAKDSKFQLFKPVVYREKRPPLYDDTLEFSAGGLFGNLEARCRAALDKIAYAKTLAWQHEGEYRLVIPLNQREEPWNTLAYHPEEITELYLGAAITDADKQDLVAKAKGLNPKIAVFQATRDGSASTGYDAALARPTLRSRGDGEPLFTGINGKFAVVCRSRGLKDVRPAGHTNRLRYQRARGPLALASGGANELQAKFSI